MAQAALDHADFGARDQAQHFGRLLPHGLGARVAGEMEGDRTVERTEAGRQPLLLGDVDDVFSNVEGGIGHFLDCWIVGTIRGHLNLSISAPDGMGAHHRCIDLSQCRNEEG